MGFMTRSVEQNLANMNVRSVKWNSRFYNCVESACISKGSVLLLLAVMMILLLLIGSILARGGHITGNSLGVFLSFGVNGLVAITFLVKSVAERPFSLTQIHWIFYLTMFVIAPLSQYYQGYSAWGYPLGEEDYLITNILLLVWAFVFAASYNLHFTSHIHRNGHFSYGAFLNSLPSISARAALVAFLIALFSTICVVGLVGFSNLFSRSDFDADLSKTLNLIFSNFIRPLPVFALALQVVRARQQNRIGILLILCIGLSLIADFPAAMPRYAAACLYGGILLLAIRPVFEVRGLFTFTFLILFLVVFPAANAYRWSDFSFAMFFEALINSIVNLPVGFCAVDYDAYSMIARTLKYINVFGCEYGYQLLGSLLFFVPRSFWPTKPDGSGNLVCAAQGQAQLNISSPLPAEGLVNFGLVGLIAFAVLLGLASKKIDRWFISSPSANRLFYPFLCFLLFFIMRGDLQSSFAFTFGYLVAFLAVLTASEGLSATCRSADLPKRGASGELKRKRKTVL